MNHSPFWTSSHCSEPGQQRDWAAHLGAESAWAPSCCSPFCQSCLASTSSPTHHIYIPTLITAASSPVLSLSLHTLCSIRHPAHLSIAPVFIYVALQTAVCHTVHSSPQQLYMQILIVMSHWSSSRSQVSEAPSTLKYHWDLSQISCSCQSQGDFLAGQEDGVRIY